MIIAKFLAVVVIGYLLGSIPIGVLVGRRLVGKDVRQFGSGKMGATNVARVAGSKAGMLVASLDILKGATPVALAGLAIGGEYLAVGGIGLGRLSAQVLAALAAIAGHTWPVFLKFRGGRGVATFFGGLVALYPAAAIFGGEVLVIGAGLTRYVSLGSITGVVGVYTMMVPLTLMNRLSIEYLVYAFVGAVIVIAMHKDNIARLLAGQERRFGEKARTADPTN
ncbi:MAG: glycerol-3-phosphate acyltransferase [Chloroflexi bacterium]|nr:glycerol-3-phosphate acyltransferase [Chloroflexota bacterium]